MLVCKGGSGQGRAPPSSFQQGREGRVRARRGAARRGGRKKTTCCGEKQEERISL
jgi:hypothetical protein